jgi:hypothetical protein
LRDQARLSLTFTVHNPCEKSFPSIFNRLPRAAAPPRTLPRYSEIEKELLARREAACFGATSGA